MDASAQVMPLLTASFDAYARYDAAGCAAAFTEDAYLASPFEPPVQGRSAIERTHQDWFEDREENKRWGVIAAEMSGQTGHCLIWFEADLPGQMGQMGQTGQTRPIGPDKVRGHSLSVLVNTPDKGWKIRALSLTVIET